MKSHKGGFQAVKEGGRVVGFRGCCSCGWLGVVFDIRDGLPFSAQRRANAEFHAHKGDA